MLIFLSCTLLDEDEKKLVDFYEESGLTPSQESAVHSLQAFLDSADDRCFILNGYAGTGKTFLIGGLVRYLKHKNRTASMMAPTGRAAHVLRERHQIEASTIHRHIYSMQSLKEYKEIDENGDITYKFYFETKNNDSEHDTVFIVDEASMISDMHSESEFMHFGSGRLLSDMIKYINFDSNDYRKKLILVGDGAQLPPFGMSDKRKSPALDADYLKEKCLLSSTTCELTDVVRQSENSPILKNATNIRKLLSTQKFPSFDFHSDDRIIKELSPDNFIQAFVQEWLSRDIQKPVIIAYTNSSTKTYNEAVRRKLFPDTHDITDGDQIIVVKNNYNYERELLNGQMGKVVAAADETESRHVPLNMGLNDEGKKTIEMIHLEFRDITLQFIDEWEKTFDITCKVCENCLHNGESQIPSEYSKALYVDFKNRHPHLKPKDPEFKEALKADPYFNAVMLKFGYAITCHKAQGGEWHTVFIDFSGKNKLNADGLRWSYTALTRAEQYVVATNALHHGILKPKKQRTVPRIEQPSLPTEPTPKTSNSGNDFPPSFESTIQASSPQDLIRNAVIAHLPVSWEITDVRSLPYNERFTLSIGHSSLTASIFYNSKNRISKVQITPTQGLEVERQTAHDSLNPLKGLSLTPGVANSTDVAPAHEAFILELKRALHEGGVKVLDIESKTEFHVIARVSDESHEGAVNYYFNKSGGLTSFMPQQSCPAELHTKLNHIHV